MSEYCNVAPGHPLHGPYHDTEYGFPITSEADLFERLVLEINQAGLSWLTVLKKRDAFRHAFDHFEVDRVAAYGDEERARLLNDAGIIRHRQKIDAVIHNAQVIQQLRVSHGGFEAWLSAHHPLPHAQWVKLFRRHFRFTGPEIVKEFLMSTGYLPGAHHDQCPVQQQVLAASPAWTQTSSDTNPPG
ncbi:DNA-3-methyladenine glycosylase I [Halomonas denitrificans]|uniref:DNA-3-methyladenine glycosylase I n=1 Tax=Halomonas denitrificans TaxID=370769 RepID=UPI001C993E55|nr:DNA-3-methyladenine glycosylase I [Halomonas denitrificans]MBY5968770.1 DNA-3-methyladenine glycosylase I [Halomonas denitrificans]